jgi:hypothetical protein
VYVPRKVRIVEAGHEQPAVNAAHNLVERSQCAWYRQAQVVHGGGGGGARPGSAGTVVAQPLEHPGLHPPCRADRQTVIENRLVGVGRRHRYERGTLKAGEVGPALEREREFCQPLTYSGPVPRSRVDVPALLGSEAGTRIAGQTTRSATASGGNTIS